MRKLSFLMGVALCVVSFHATAMAQGRDGGGYVEIYWEEEPPPEVEVSTVTPSPSPPVIVPPVIVPPPPPRPPLPPREDIYSFEDKALDAVTSDYLETFDSEASFGAYLRRLEKVKDERDYHWSANGTPILIAASMQDAAEQNVAEQDVCANPKDCPPEEASVVAVTGTRISTPATSITNVQAFGVDEGDIVKQIGDYFLILQDGRIFAVNTKTMQLTDRVNVYRPLPEGAKKKRSWYDDFEGADWYDEMLVQDDHVLITAYSYEEDATEFSIFKLDQATGKVSPQGVFLISSDDYYSSDNYATRIVGDRLVMYTPYSMDQFEDREERPVIRRWLPYEERQKIAAEEAEGKRGKPLFGARDLYKPVLRTGEPTIHTVSVCPLGDYKPGADLRCRTTGFVGPEEAEMYVSPDNVYLWNSYGGEEVDTWSRNDCAAAQMNSMPRRRDTLPAALYRMNIRSGETAVAGVSGGVFDQFSMEEQGKQFYALSAWPTIRCNSDVGDHDIKAFVNLMALKDSHFSTEFRAAPDRSFTPVPTPQGNMVENRFVGDWLVYGGRKRYNWYWSDQPDPEDLKAAAENTAIAVPLKRPKDAQAVPLGHSIIRLERLGDDAVLNGYLKGDGLNVSVMKLGKMPRIASSAFLPNRFESESRSHAFNGITDVDGSGVMGIPTTLRDADSDRYAWWSGKSDLSFLTLNAQGQLSSAGELQGKGEKEVQEHESYTCEVSCIDWYGNARPIFTAGRIFGLMGTNLVEAQIRDGRIGTIANIDLTAPIGTKAAAVVTEATGSPAN